MSNLQYLNAESFVQGVLNFEAAVHRLEQASDAFGFCSEAHAKTMEEAARTFANAINAERRTMRDTIAIAAMQSMILGGVYDKFEYVASDAYKVADAMLQARNGGET